MNWRNGRLIDARIPWRLTKWLLGLRPSQQVRDFIRSPTLPRYLGEMGLRSWNNLDAAASFTYQQTTFWFFRQTRGCPVSHSDGRRCEAREIGSIMNYLATVINILATSAVFDIAMVTGAAYCIFHCGKIR